MNFMMRKGTSWKASSLSSFIFHIAGILAPMLYEGCHVRWQIGIELDPFACSRMDETKSLGMKGLSWTN
jgi:hypothetical protein